MMMWRGSEALCARRWVGEGQVWWRRGIDLNATLEGSRRCKALRYRGARCR